MPAGLTPADDDANLGVNSDSLMGDASPIPTDVFIVRSYVSERYCKADTTEVTHTPPGLDDNWRAGRCTFKKGGVVAVCRVNRGMVKLNALLPEGHTRAWQCKDVPLICQRLQVDLLDTGYPVG